MSKKDGNKWNQMIMEYIFLLGIHLFMHYIEWYFHWDNYTFMLGETNMMWCLIDLMGDFRAFEPSSNGLELMSLRWESNSTNWDYELS